MSDVRNYAVYIRLSLEDDNIDGEEKLESNSIVAQRSYLRAYYKRELDVDAEDIVEYCDDGYTGTNFNRPSFQKLLEDVKAERIQCVIVKDFSRLGRDYIEVGNLLEYIFPLMQVRFISVNDGYDSEEKFGSTGGMSVGLQNLVYTMYSRDLSEKVRSAKRIRMQRGEYMSGVPKFGYRHDPKDKHKLVVDEEAAKIVRRVFALAYEGTSSYEICRIFNAEGVETIRSYQARMGWTCPDTRTKKDLWGPNVITHIIREKMYLGHMVSGRSETRIIDGGITKLIPEEDWIIVENTHEPLVSQEVFDKANDSIQKYNQPITKQRKSNPLFICGVCGKAIMYRKGAKRYLCRTACYEPNSECQCVRGVVDDIESAVLQTVNTMAAMVESRKKNAKIRKAVTLPEQISNTELELKRVHVKKMDLYNAYSEGNLERECYVAKANELRDLQDQLKKKLESLSKELQEQESISQADDDTIEKMKSLQTFDRDEIHNVIDKVILYSPDEMEIIWKYDDWYQTI